MTLTTPTWEQFVITGLLRAGGKTPVPRSVKLNAGLTVVFGGLQLSSAGTVVGKNNTEAILTDLCGRLVCSGRSVVQSYCRGSRRSKAAHRE